jgi:hypothetical protein
LSRTEQQVVAQLAPLWQATPETIGVVRELCGADYRRSPADYLDTSSESALFTRLKRDVSFSPASGQRRAVRAGIAAARRLRLQAAARSL